MTSDATVKRLMRTWLLGAWLRCGLAILMICLGLSAGSVSRAQDVFSSGDQPDSGGSPPGGNDTYVGGNFGSVIPRSQCTGINQVWNMGRCNARQLPGYTGCGPWYNNYSYFIQDTLQHLGGMCEMRGNVLWCPQRRAGMCNPSAGGEPGTPLVDTGIRFDQSCQSHCDPAAGNGGGLPPNVPASNAPLQGLVSNTPPADTGCTGGASPADQQTARQVAAAAQQIAVNTVMGTSSFLQGSAQVIDDYARFLALPPGESVNQMGKGIQQTGAAVAAYWNNKDPQKNQSLLRAAQGAVDAFRRDPARGAGLIAGNVLLGYAGGGVCQVGKGAAAAVAKRIAQARTATGEIAQVEQVAGGFARSVKEGGGFSDQTPPGGSPSYGQTPQGGVSGSGLPGKIPQSGVPPINDRGLSTNCTQCTIAGLKRMMRQGVPTASDIMVTTGDRTLFEHEVYDLLRQNFGKSPPKWLTAEQLKLHAQGVPLDVKTIGNLEQGLGGVLQSGTAGNGVLPKGVVMITPNGGVGGHVIGAIQTPNGLRLVDWQSRVYNSQLVQQLFVDPLSAGGTPPDIWFYPVE